MRKSLAILSLCAASVVAAPASAETPRPAGEAGSPATAPPPQTAVPAAENGRFTMTPTPSGFLRLDTRTGVVSLCTVSGASAQCRPSADERAALESEIGRLADENARLRAAAKTGKETGAPAAAADPGGARLPTDAEVDHAIGLLDKIARGLVRVMKHVDDDSHDKE